MTEKGVSHRTNDCAVKLEFIFGVLALAFMWAAFWSVIAVDQMVAGADMTIPVEFAISLAIGQATSVALCLVILHRASRFLCRLPATLGLSIAVAIALSLFFWVVGSSFGANIVLGMIVGLTAGLLWVQAALFLSRVPAKAIAITLASSSLFGAAIIFLRGILEPNAADIFFVAMIPLSLALFYLAYRFKGEGPARRHGVMPAESHYLKSVRENFFKNRTLYVVIFVFALVFGMQIGLGADTARAFPGYAALSFSIPGVLLLITYYGFNRSINFRTLCLVVLLSTIVSLLPWGFDTALTLSLRKVIVYAAFTLFDLSVIATLVEVGSIENTPSAIPMLIGRAFIMIGVVAGMLLALTASAGLVSQPILDSASVVTLVAVFALFTLIRQIFNPKREGDEPERPFYEAIRRVSEGHGLSARESEILLFLAKGYNAQRIQNELTISQNTVKSHIYHIYSKLNVHTQQEAILVVEGIMASIKDGRLEESMVARR